MATGRVAQAAREGCCRWDELVVDGWRWHGEKHRVHHRSVGGTCGEAQAAW
ncbi:hypothetical protein [Streptomyces sp. NPDC001389]|uniref:hypothetical protein n=1 Tax=Streptomyces sp. NPDC001389 TaxID=3364569 RepID=UPI00369CB1EA